MSAAPTSAEIRARILAARKALTPAEARARSEAVCARVLAALAGQPLAGWTLALYQAMPGEVDLGSLAPALAVQGATLVYPRITDRASRELEFAPAPESGWEEGPYGIREPHSSSPAVAPGLIDLIFVPGVAFGPNGERLGMGKGFYDRFLPAVRPDCMRWSAAFDFQVVSALEQAPWDQPVHRLFSESRDYRVRTGV